MLNGGEKWIWILAYTETWSKTKNKFLEMGINKKGKSKENDVTITKKQTAILEFKN